MRADDVEVVDRTRVYDGYLKVERFRLRHRRHQGGWTGEMSRELIERGHAVAVLPYDPARDVVVLIEQFRIGAYAAGIDPWQIEIVAGIIEPGEALDDVARRESLEEAGCAVGELIPACRFLTSPGVLSETVEIFVGRTDSQGLGGVHGLDAEHEDIRVLTAGLDEALAWLDQGRIQNAPAVVALLWLGRHREAVRRRWRD